MQAKLTILDNIFFKPIIENGFHIHKDKESIVRLNKLFWIASIVSSLLLSACSSAPSAYSGPLNVVATTQIIGDVVNAIGGDSIQLVTLIPPDSDPHAFEPTPQDASRLSAAAVIFSNGFNLEEGLTTLLQANGDRVTQVSDGVPPIEFAGSTEEPAGGNDPHAWMNPQNVKIWVDNIASSLGKADPANATAYSANAAAYKAKLDELDSWARGQIGELPVAQRVLVTDHEAFGYFADHYGFQIVGALIPSYSTLSEPSAGELADLETAIRQYDVQAVFVGSSMNPALGEQVAADTGIQMVVLYTEALSPADGPAATYLDLIRYDVLAIVGALK